jgi:hypothetical protein
MSIARGVPMIVALAVYLLVGIALGMAWISSEIRVQPYRNLLPSVLIVTLVWPIFAAGVGALLVAVKSRKHD